jgi:hypothetical protein
MYAWLQRRFAVEGEFTNQLAVQCLTSLAGEYAVLYTSELETLASHCFKAFDASNYAVRSATATLLATLLANAHIRPMNCAFNWIVFAQS